jgi:hypothetical protein
VLSKDICGHQKNLSDLLFFPFSSIITIWLIFTFCYPRKNLYQ